MNHSIYSADRATHLKIIVSTLLASMTIMTTILATRPAHPEINAGVTATQTVSRPNSNQALTELVRTGRHPI